MEFRMNVGGVRARSSSSSSTRARSLGPDISTLSTLPSTRECTATFYISEGREELILGVASAGLTQIQRVSFRESSTNLLFQPSPSLSPLQASQLTFLLFVAPLTEETLSSTSDLEITSETGEISTLLPLIDLASFELTASLLSLLSLTLFLLLSSGNTS